MRKLLAAFLLPVLIFSGCRNSDFKRVGGMIWNTTYNITYDGAPELADSITLTLNRVSKSLNYFDPSSLLTQVNRSEAFAVDSNFIQVYTCAKKIYELTDGAFDPTLAPVIDAWGFGKGHQASPDTANIDKLRDIVGMDKTGLVGDSIRKISREVTFNFSAIAKGFACDEVGRMFQRNGVKNFLVEIGGEVVCSGESPAGRKWNVAIDRPEENSDKRVAEVLQLSGQGCATSGNYRNYKEENGQKYGHTISAKSLRPAKTDVLSATVVASDCMKADAWATSFMAMGSKKAINLILREKLAALLILANDSVFISPEMKGYLKKMD